MVNRDSILEKYGINPIKKILLASGTTWIKTKGLEDYSKLAEILPNDFQLVLVGIGKAEAVNLSKKIIAIPRTESQSELAEFYSAAEILLCLSYQESFGMTPVEAMACGTPAIVYDNTALSELITPETGRLVETGNLQSVMEMILEVSTIGKNAFSSECIKRVNLIYDTEVTYQKYLNMYNELIKK